MSSNPNPAITDIYPKCVSALGEARWSAIVQADIDYKKVPEALASAEGIPGYIPDLAKIELARHAAATAEILKEKDVAETVINPSIRAVEASFLHLADIVNGEDKEPEPGAELVLAWRGPRTGNIYVRAASSEDLLVLKVVTEGLSAEEVAKTGGLSAGAVERAMFRGADSGLVIMPPSKVRRPDGFPNGKLEDDRFLSTDAFTLQWHLTQACDLHCKHCYDRTDRKPLPLEKALDILEQFREFCRSRYVEGHISFSGGNPLMYPHFLKVYGQAVEYGFGVALLGNPTSREMMQKIIDIEMPSFFQISLEGLEDRNDAVRGEGHFKRSMEFLKLLKEMSVPTMVMLTLTEDNVDDVIPLGLKLEGLADSYNFNRLSSVGEGASLRLPEKERFKEFLGEYLKASREHPHMRLKENLFNILLHEEGQPLKGGCTGYGCGAAFNFITLLADGEVHACRKFPSLIGNIYEKGLDEIYSSPLAGRYRLGCAECEPCPIRPVCGGCLAVSHGLGIDALTQKDRYCFFEQSL